MLKKKKIPIFNWKVFISNRFDIFSLKFLKLNNYINKNFFFSFVFNNKKFKVLNKYLWFFYNIIGIYNYKLNYSLYQKNLNFNFFNFNKKYFFNLKRLDFKFSFSFFLKYFWNKISFFFFFFQTKKKIYLKQKKSFISNIICVFNKNYLNLWVNMSLLKYLYFNRKKTMFINIMNLLRYSFNKLENPFHIYLYKICLYKLLEQKKIII